MRVNYLRRRQLLPPARALYTIPNPQAVTFFRGCALKLGTVTLFRFQAPEIGSGNKVTVPNFSQRPRNYNDSHN